MIPVIGIPYLSNPDLLFECLESISQDQYGFIHIIDNSPTKDPLVLPMGVRMKPRLLVTRGHRNLGVSASWNLLIKLHSDAPWWAITNSDLILGEGDLERLEENIAGHGLVAFQGMHLFGIRGSTIQAIGWFDENFVPGYFEDNDYHYRCGLLGSTIYQLDMAGTHVMSSTLLRSDRYKAENARTFPLNARYYVEKWGGPVGQETYKTPFDQGSSPRDWTLDITRLASQSWKE